MLKIFIFYNFFSGIILISIIFLPSFFLPQKFVLLGGKLMGYWTSFCLKIILSVKYKILGKENIATNKIYFIASHINQCLKHFYLQTIFNSPIFILKKELLFIPIFGWYLKKLDQFQLKEIKFLKIT